MCSSARLACASVFRDGSSGHASLRVEAAFDVVQHRRFVLAVRDDERVMIHRRHVELHAVELQHLGDHFARGLQLRIRARQVQLRVVRTAVIRRHHPRQAVHPRAVRVDRCGVAAVHAGHRLRRVLGLVVVGAPVAVDVRIAGEPLPLRLQAVSTAHAAAAVHDDEQAESANVSRVTSIQHKSAPGHAASDPAPMRRQGWLGSWCHA